MNENVVEALGIGIGARIPMLLWGGPGVGKTSALQALAAAANLPCELVISSIREPSDFSGLPVIGSDGRSVHLVPPSWATRLADAGRGVLFLDEISTAAPAVQAALMRIVLERTVGDLALPEAVAIVAAANPPEQAADGWDLAAPLANRFCHLTWPLDVNVWRHGVLAGFTVGRIPHLEEAKLVSRTRLALSAITGFIAHRPTLLHNLPDDERHAGQAWPSPRTWTMAARLLAAAEGANANAAVVQLLIVGAVGPGAGAEFLAWRQDLDLPDPEAVLADPTSLVLPPRPDRAYAVLSSIVAAVLNDNTTTRWEAAWRALGTTGSGPHADLAVTAVRSLIEHRPKGAVPPRDVLVAIAPLLRASGLLDRLVPSP